VTDEIRLVIPSDEGFRPIARLVTGGLALRLDLTFDRLEDLQLAVDALLVLRNDDGDVVVELGVEESALRVVVGPFAPEALRELGEGGDQLGLRRVLETVCDSVTWNERDDGAWVELTKRTAA
jgi:anti-sigma regulatory factor (Ser/Thr protein kinase)